MKDTVIIRHKTTRDFTILKNAPLRDVRISWKALGILAYLLHLPGDFRLNLAYLAALRMKGGSRRDATRSGIRELEETGYVTITRERDDLGQWSDVTWTVTDTPDEGIDAHPHSENPFVDKPPSDAPRPAKPTLLSTEVNKELILKRTTRGHYDLHFPQLLGKDDRNAAMQMLSHVPTQRAQEILDELAGVLESGKTIRTTPLRWLCGIIRRSDRGNFKQVAGVRISTSRAAAEQERRSREAARGAPKPSDREVARAHLNAIRQATAKQAHSQGAQYVLQVTSR